MKNESHNRFDVVDSLFRKYSERILNYISSRINNHEDAENLAQDVWLRILESEVELSPDTARSYIFRVATNLINDYLRALYIRKGASEELQYANEYAATSTPDAEVSARQIAEMELRKVSTLPKQRRIIYTMSRFEDLNVAEIAERLSLSFRTVENHLRMGRHDVRNYISSIA